jgi:hypothetical protein
VKVTVNKVQFPALGVAPVVKVIWWFPSVPVILDALTPVVLAQVALNEILPLESVPPRGRIVAAGSTGATLKVFTALKVSARFVSEMVPVFAGSVAVTDPNAPVVGAIVIVPLVAFASTTLPTDVPATPRSSTEVPSVAMPATVDSPLVPLPSAIPLLERFEAAVTTFVPSNPESVNVQTVVAVTQVTMSPVTGAVANPRMVLLVVAALPKIVCALAEAFANWKVPATELSVPAVGVMNFIFV